MPWALTTEEIQDVIQQFADAAKSGKCFIRQA